MFYIMNVTDTRMLIAQIPIINQPIIDRISVYSYSIYSEGV